jgi:hypothetical protein
MEEVRRVCAGCAQGVRRVRRLMRRVCAGACAVTCAGTCAQPAHQPAHPAHTLRTPCAHPAHTKKVCFSIAIHYLLSFLGKKIIKFPVMGEQ